MVKNYLFTIAFISWMMFVTFSSLYSFEGVASPRFNIPHPDKIIHFIFYSVASILGILFLRERSRGTIPLQKAILFMVFLTIAFGITIEIIQHVFTTQRTGDVFDAMANSFGSLFGAIVIKIYFSGKRLLNWKF